MKEVVKRPNRREQERVACVFVGSFFPRPFELKKRRKNLTVSL